ncbi:MAG: hypothetical protein Q9203_000974, partial [Teloschistes exilis]
MALQDYWGPLLAFAAVSTIVQFATLGYCIRVYIRSLFKDDSRSQNSSGLPSHNGSIKTVTAKQAYSRVHKAVAVQWRGIVVVIIIIVNVVFLAVVFVSMDNTEQAVMQNFGKAEPWLTCLVLNRGDKEACLDKVNGLATPEPTVMAVLILMSLNGIWTLLFLGRLSMVPAWVELIRKRFRRSHQDFASVDARRFSASPRHYEMMTSPPQTAYSTLKMPEAAVTSPSIDGDTIAVLSPQSQEEYFPRDAKYVSPTMSFSTPRPPSSGRHQDTLNMQLQNQTGKNTVYAYVTGHDIHRNNDWFLLQADGVTPYYPIDPGEGQRLQRLQANCSIPLNPSGGSPKTVTVPRIASARIYFSIDQEMTFLLNQGPALVEPDINNPQDPNIDIEWDFCEFTYDDRQLFCNITYVDFVSIPISLTLVPQESGAETQHVTGIRAEGLARIQEKLETQAQSDGQPWNELRLPNGLRIISPAKAASVNPALFAGYFEPYIDAVWSAYSENPLHIDTGTAEWGIATGTVDTNNDILTFPSRTSPGNPITFTKPTTRDILSCDTGPLRRANDEAGCISARIAAACNRTTLLHHNTQPANPPPAEYYTGGRGQWLTNHYSR